MRIIQVVNALTFGGAQVIILDLAKKLLDEGHAVEVLAFRDGPIGKKLRDAGCPTHILGESMLDFLAFQRFNRIVKDFKPDIIHSHLFRATFWSRMVRMFNPQVYLITSVHGRESDFFHACERLTAGISDYITFPSEYLRQWYLKNIRKLPRTRTGVIYPGVDIVSEISADESTDQYSLPVIGTLSRLHPVKGVDLLIRAAAKLKQKEIDFEVLIGGDGRQRSELTQLAESLKIADHCRFVGEIDDVKGFLDRFSIFVAASRQEAFGIHVCEAMERGIPVVAARIDGLVELIEHEHTGLLFESGNADSLADELERLIKDPALQNSLALAARNKVTATFNRRIAIEKHLKLYSSLAYRPRHLHFIISSGELGGGERLALSLIRGFQQRGWLVSATCCGQPLTDELRASGIEYSSSGLRLAGFFFALRSFFDLIRKRPDLISSHLNKASLFAGVLGKILRIPVISHVHGLNRRLYYTGSSHLIAVSDSVRQHLLAQGVTAEKITVIKNAVPFNAAQKIRVPGDPIKIAIIAKLHRNKGHEWALRALLQNSAALPNFELHILGDGPERRNLKRVCDELDKKRQVHFYGFVKDVRPHLEKIDLALLPSLGEGIPLSLLEAMSLGIPVVATKVGGIPEIVEEDRNGLLVPPNDTEALIGAISRATDLINYQRLSRGALEKFSELNDFEEMVEETASVFAELCSK